MNCLKEGGVLLLTLLFPRGRGVCITNTVTHLRMLLLVWNAVMNMWIQLAMHLTFSSVDQSVQGTAYVSKLHNILLHILANALFTCWRWNPINLKAVIHLVTNWVSNSLTTLMTWCMVSCHSSHNSFKSHRVSPRDPQMFNLCNCCNSLRLDVFQSATVCDCLRLSTTA